MPPSEIPQPPKSTQKNPIPRRRYWSAISSPSKRHPEFPCRYTTVGPVGSKDAGGEILGDKNKVCRTDCTSDLHLDVQPCRWTWTLESSGCGTSSAVIGGGTVSDNQTNKNVNRMQPHCRARFTTWAPAVDLHAAAVGEREVLAHAEDIANFEHARPQVRLVVLSSRRPVRKMPYASSSTAGAYFRERLCGGRTETCRPGRPEAV